jgi:hypothetical protein
LAVVFALLIAHAAFFRKLIYLDSCCDAASYQELSRRIVDHGLFSAAAFSDLRTYGYPLFLSGLGFVERLTSIPITLLALEVQLCVYILALWLLRDEIRRFSLPVAEGLFVASCLNVFVLTYAAETLTESLSISIIVLLAWCWLWSVREFRSRAWALSVITGGTLAGFAVMVRPAHIFLPVVWVSGQAILVVSRCIGPRPGDVRRRAAAFALMLVAIAAPCVPQFYNNVVFGHAATPLVASNLGTHNMNLGITNLKFITGRPPLRTERIYYFNPFSENTKGVPDYPLRWYSDNPSAGVKTLLLHGFALLDQDFIFPYVIDLAPLYGIPLSILNHVGIGLSAYALWLWFRAARGQSSDRPISRISLPVLLLYILGTFTIYCTVAVEARFGLPLILLAAPLAVTALRHFRSLHGRRVVLLAAAIAVYTIAATAGSQWMRNQAPAIANFKSLRPLELFAILTSPTPGTVLSATDVTLTWSSAAGADQYWLDMGTSLGKGDIAAVVTTSTSHTVKGVPCDGRTLYVQLYTHVHGGWQFLQRYTYTAPSGCAAPPPQMTSPTPVTTLPFAQMISPRPQTVLSKTTAVFAWNPAAGAHEYWLDVGTNLGTGDLFAGAMTRTSKTVTGLPCDGRTLYVQLYTRINGAWQSLQRYTYKAPTVCAQ